MGVPHCMGCYWDLLQEIEPGVPMYGIESMRIRFHEEILEHYGITKEASQEVLHHLDKYKTVGQVHSALTKLKKRK